MEFEEEEEKEQKEKIRAIFKAKGIPESLLDIPWIMESILVDVDDSLEHRIIKSNKTDSFIYVSKNNERMLIKRCEDNSCNIIVEDGDSEVLQIKRKIILNKYGMEQQRETYGTSSDYTIYKRTDSGTIVRRSYENEKLKSEEEFLDSGNCFLESPDGLVLGMPLKTINNSEEKPESRRAILMDGLSLLRYEQALIYNAGYFINNYPITEEFYEMLSRSVSGVIDFSLSYLAKLAEQRATDEDVKRLVGAIANNAGGSGQSWIGNSYPRRNVEGSETWRQKAKNSRYLSSHYNRRYYNGLGGNTLDDSSQFPNFD